MICTYCALEFAKDAAQPACLKCPLSGGPKGCGRVRCPRCGWEAIVVEESKFVERLKGLWRKAS